MKTFSNGFEEAIIVHNGTDAFDTGVCTFHDDDKVTVEIPEGIQVQIAYRYGDEREDDTVPSKLNYLSAYYAEKALGIKIRFE